VWGVSHPPGYPLYLTLVRIAQLVPLGDLAHRAALFSAIAAAISVGLVYATVRTLVDASGWRTQVAAVFGALTFASAPLLWSQSVVAEVYSFGQLLLATFLLCLARWVCQPSRGRALATTTALAVLATHQPQLGAAFLALAGLAWQRRLPPREWVAASLPIVLIPLLFATLWLRAIFQPPLNWGDPSTFDRWLSHITAHDYQRYFAAWPISDELPRLPAAAVALVRQTDWIGALTAVLGVLWLWTERRPFVVVAGLTAALLAAFTVLYNAENAQVYLLPTVQFLAVGAGVGAAWVLSAFDGLPVAIGSLGLALFIGWRVTTTWPEVDASHDLVARQWGESTLAAAPPEAVLHTQREDYTFVLWYLHVAEGQRPDVAIVDDRLLALAWYREQLARIDPRLVTSSP
jgi:hypothetical protein